MSAARLFACLLALGLVAGAPAQAKRKKADPTETAPRVDVAKMAEAQKKAQAQKLVTEARIAFDKGAFAEASTRFQEAYRLFPVPKMLYNIGITFEALRNRGRAVCSLERFLEEAPDADPALRTDAQQKVEKMKPRVGYVEVTAPDGAVLFIDGEEQAVAPAKHPLCAEVGTHRVVALVAGVAPVGLDVPVSEKGPTKVALDPASNTAKIVSAPEADKVVVAKPVDKPSGEKPIYKKWWFWTAVGGAVAVGVTATVLGVELKGTNVTPPAADYGPFPIFQR